MTTPLERPFGEKLRPSHYLPKICPDRNRRRCAYSEIYDVLGANSLTERLWVLRHVEQMLWEYDSTKTDEDNKDLMQQEEKWLADISATAWKLHSLIKQNPYLTDQLLGIEAWLVPQTRLPSGQDYYTDLDTALLALASMGGTTLLERKEGKQYRSFATLIRSIASLYHTATGEKPGRNWDGDRGRLNDKSPFVRLIRAICCLGNISKTDAAIDTAIRRHADSMLSFYSS